MSNCDEENPERSCSGFFCAWLITIVNHASPLRQEGAFMRSDFLREWPKKTASSQIKGNLLFVVHTACC
ncbi:hypothetical protein C1T21_23625 [Paenibacillus sp. F4]|nr:hypothetical protein AM598_02145 [Paenibacillus polymyxa]PNQ78436.1 hypothetical protein C1T21_23625 [Paenibacillus sp. F4]